MATVIPLRPFENALRQAAKSPAPIERGRCIRAVLAEVLAGRSGNAVASELQRARFAPAPITDGAA